MVARTLQSAKTHYFEEGTSHQPFRHAGWRGCVVDRDFFDNARMPEELWVALVAVCSPEVISVCGYFDGVDGCKSASADWRSFRKFMLDPENYSPEYMVFDGSGDWAILADQDVTTFGSDSRIADRIDSYLSKLGTSLVQLTLDSFGSEDLLSVGGNYIRSVLGKKGTEAIKPKS